MHSRLAYTRFSGGTLTLVVALLMATPSARASHIASETFESYTAGTNLNGGSGGTGWTTNWTTTAGHVTVQTKHLQAGFNNGQTQASRIQPTAFIGNDNSIMRRGFSATTSTVYLSFLLRLESFEQQDFIQIQVSNGATGDNAGTLSVGAQNQLGNPFYARVGLAANTTTSAVSAMNNTDYFLVAKFSKDGGSATFNRTDLFLNPVGREESGNIPIATRIGPSTGLTQLSQFNVRVFNLATNDLFFLDNIQVGDTFFDVTPAPEPSSLAMLSIGLGALALGGRSRWKRLRKAA